MRFPRRGKRQSNSRRGATADDGRRCRAGRTRWAGHDYLHQPSPLQKRRRWRDRAETVRRVQDIRCRWRGFGSGFYRHGGPFLRGRGSEGPRCRRSTQEARDRGAGRETRRGAGDPHKKREIGGHDTIAPMGPSRLRLSKPVIAAVEGFAVAGGMELALWADMRVVAEDATFGIFCRRFGVPLIDLGTIRLPRLIGHSQAIDLILTGRPVGGPEALRIGLANRLVPKGEACAQAIALAKEIARFPQTCMRADRLSALRQWDLSEEDAIANEMRGGLEVIASGETLSGATRFASGAGRHGAFGGQND